MSSREGRLQLSPKAQQDLIDILRYTRAHWGDEQLLVYRDKLNDALSLITHNPEIGHLSPVLPSTHRVLAVGSHLIIYRHQVQVIGVVRILHQRTHLARHL
ncbi:MAG TPA: type II toxin-antitoxin system RelE/ParE family toxin [Steroidobacteraceae bacterium]|nr:type II toxin-antitoxin system RelE/ParE family toxin [Steroidobacteraceae bacterium]